MPSTIYKFELQIDASEAEAAARAFRQTVERELGQIQTQSKPAGAGGILGPEIQQANAGLAQTKTAIQSADQALADMGRKFGQMNLDDLRNSIRAAAKDLGELRSALEGIRLPSTRDANIRAQIDQFYAAAKNSWGDTPELRAAQSEGRIPSWGHLSQGMHEVSDKGKPPSEWSVNTQQAIKEANQSAEEYAQASLKYYTAMAEEAQAGRAMLERLEQQMSQELGSNDLERVFAEYDELGQESARWAEQQAEALEGISEAQATLARISQEQAADAERVATQARNHDALKAGDFGTLTGGGGGGGADATIRVTATKAAADNYDRILESMREMALHAETISQAESKTAAAVATAQTHFAELDSARRSAEMETRRGMADAEKLLQIEKTSTEEKKRAQAELRKGTAEINKQTQAEKTKTEAAKAATATAQAQLEIEKAKTAATLSLAHQRKRAADAEYQERTQAARASAQREIEEQRRVTQAMRAETATRSRLGGMLGNAGRSLLWAGAGALGLYGIDGAARTAMQAGKQGAAMMQTEESFRGLADRMEVDADRMIKAIQMASGETISEMDAISYGVQVMAQRFASSSDDIGGDTALLIEYARRLSQMGFADAEGNFLKIGDVMSRLIGFTREGNKELVDQFGLSNQVIADLMGVTKDGLAGATGAAIRWAGMLKFAQEEMERLGPAARNAASEIAGSEARITDSINQIRQAAAEPIAITLEYVAAGAGWLAFDFIRRGDQGYDDPFGQMRDTGLGGQSTRQINEAEGRLRGARSAGMGRIGEDSSMDWAERANAAGQYNDEIERLARLYQTIAGLTQSGDLDATEAQAAAQAWEETVSGLEKGTISIEEAGDGATELERLINEAAGATVFVQTGAAGMKEEIAAAADEADRLKISIGDTILDMATLEGRLNYLGISQQRRDQRAQANALAGNLPGAEYEGNGASLALAQMRGEKRAALIDERAKLEKQIAADRQALDKQTAQAATAAWKSAAAETAQAFDNAISKIPGIGGLSPVTAEQMAAAKAGIPQNFADNYLRRLEDEIVNKKDWAGVDVGDAARRMGLDPGMDPRVVLQQMKDQWASGELFAGGANLDLIDLDAVKAAYEQQARQEEGQKELRRYIGQALGIDVDAMDAQAKATYATTDNTTSLDENTAALAEVNAALAALSAGPPPALAPIEADNAQRDARLAAEREDAGLAATRAAQAATEEIVRIVGNPPATYVDTAGTMPRRIVGNPPAGYVDTSGTMPSYDPYLAGAVPESTFSGPWGVANLAPTLAALYMGGSMPIEGGQIAAQGLSGANLPAMGPALPSIAGGMISTLIGIMAGAQDLATGSQFQLPLVTKDGDLDAMLGDQPETIGLGLMERIGQAVEDVPLVQSIRAIWDRDIQDNAKELEGVGTAIALKINSRLEKDLGALKGGGLVDVIVARVLEALAADE